MSYFSNNPRDVGITVIGGLTGHGDMTQAELDQKIEDIKESLRVKKPLMMEEYLNANNSDTINELHEKYPPFKAGSGSENN